MEAIMGIAGIFGFIISFIPIIVAIILISWLYVIKNNSDKQVAQNKEIIELLKQMKEGS